MATPIKWSDELSVGIELIDAQHRRIVEFINQLNEARETGDRRLVLGVLAGLSDYTVTHFGFEEAAMAAANFSDAGQHRRVHERFVLRLTEFRQRYALGEDVSGEVLDTLNKWLINHIQRDDRDYMAAIRANLDGRRLAAILAQCEVPEAQS